MTEKIIIWDKNTYISFDIKGDYKVIQDGECVCGTARRKDKIVRTKKLPKWCRENIEKGFWIEVNEFVPKGTDRDDFYLEVRGRAVKPQIRIDKRDEVKQEYRPIYGGKQYFGATVIVHKEREVRFYGNHEDCGRWKESKSLLYGFLESELEEFKMKNPLPMPKSIESMEYSDSKSEYRFDFGKGIAERTDIDFYSLHVQGVRYEYNVLRDSEKGCYYPIIKEVPTDLHNPIRREVERTILAILKVELVNQFSFTSTEKYESNDGMRMEYDSQEYTTSVYEITLSDGTTQRYQTTR